MAASGTTPLICLDAAAIDCETTGLDPAKARLLEIAAVALDGGDVAATPLFAVLVDPGVPIPVAASQVHGIDAAAVKGAPAAAAVLPGFIEAVGDRVVLGHSVGFDLAIIDGECARAGLPPWRPAWVLDLRLLAQVAAPRLADYSLEALAVWLALPLSGRHRAAGDARATAALFQALVPRLREGGIRTLAEAEAACRALTEVLDRQHLAGWVEPVASPARRDAERRLGRIDAFAYCHRVGALMTAPPIIVGPETPLRAVLSRIAEARIGSVFVEGGDAEARLGIVTERDALRAIDRDGAAALDHEAGTIMSTPLASVAADAFAYRAIGRMDRLKIRHLGVTDEAGRLVGALSMRDLMRLRAQEAVNLGDAIDVALDMAALGRAWAALPLVAEALLAEGIAAPAIAAVVSSEVASLTRRVAELAVEHLAAEGRGPPPRPFAVIVLGSVGRGESLLAMDQDNALVFADGPEPDEAVDGWYAAFGQVLADRLNEVGVPYCKGGVMASKRAWRGSSASWRRRVADWLRRSRPEDVLDVDIFFDLRPVHGEVALGEELRAHALAEAAPATGFIKLLAEAGAAGGSPFGLLGGLREVEGRIDLKQAGLFRIVTTARCLAIRHGVTARGTGNRLLALAERGLGGREDLDGYMDAHGFLLELVLRQQLADIGAGATPGNAVQLDRLSRAERRRLKAALKALETAPDLVRDLLFAAPRAG